MFWSFLTLHIQGLVAFQFDIIYFLSSFLLTLLSLLFLIVWYVLFLLSFLRFLSLQPFSDHPLKIMIFCSYILGLWYFLICCSGFGTHLFIFNPKDFSILDKNRSTVAHWYAICYLPGGPGFKSRQGRELLLLNKKEFNNLNLNTIKVWVYESGSW